MKEALVDYARRSGVTVVKGSNRVAKIRFSQRLKFPGKNDPDRRELDKIIMKAGNWQDVSELDTSALTKVVKEGLWNKELIDQVMRYGRLEENSVVYLVKPEEGG